MIEAWDRYHTVSVPVPRMKCSWCVPSTAELLPPSPTAPDESSCSCWYCCCWKILSSLMMRMMKMMPLWIWGAWLLVLCLFCSGQFFLGTIFSAFRPIRNSPLFNSRTWNRSDNYNRSIPDIACAKIVKTRLLHASDWIYVQLQSHWLKHKVDVYSISVPGQPDGVMFAGCVIKIVPRAPVWSKK